MKLQSGIVVILIVMCSIMTMVESTLTATQELATLTKQTDKIKELLLSLNRTTTTPPSTSDAIQNCGCRTTTTTSCACRSTTTTTTTATEMPTTITAMPTSTTTTEPPICIPENCFDCTKIKKDCTKVRQNCDSDEIFDLRQRLCEKEKKTEKLYGCDIPATSITIFPAAYFDESIPDYVPLNVEIRKDCCLNLSGLYYRTLSGIEIAENACVELLDGSDCTGESLRVDSSFPSDCWGWIDCQARLDNGGVPFNDRTASLRLCQV